MLSMCFSYVLVPRSTTGERQVFSARCRLPLGNRQLSVAIFDGTATRTKDLASNQNSPRARRREEERSSTGDRSEGRAWLDNPGNVQRFFERVASASEAARAREQR